MSEPKTQNWNMRPKSVAIRGRTGLFRLCILGSLLLINACADRNSSPEIKTLNRGLNGDPESLDPHIATSTQAADVLRDIGEGLVRLSRSGEIEGGCAESWEVQSDGIEYHFKLRPNLRWSNGEPLVAEDFVRSFQNLVSPSLSAKNSDYLAPIRNFRDVQMGRKSVESLGVTALDDLTLVITLDAPAAHFLQLLLHPSTFPVYPGSGRKTISESDARKEKLVTNGAYIVEEHVAKSYIRLQKNVFYWDAEETSIPIVVYHFVSPSAEVIRFRAGELDITDNVSEDTFALLKRNRAEELRISPMLGVYYYGINLTKGLFKDDPFLRQALSLAIDRKVLVRDVLGRGEIEAYSWVPPGTANHTSEHFDYANLPRIEQVSLARKYLARSSYSVDAGMPIELRYNTGGGHETIALAVKSMWEDVLDLRVSLVGEDFKVFLSNVRDMEKTHIYRLSWTADYNDAYAFLSLFHSQSTWNLTGYANAQVDMHLDKAVAESDPKSRESLLRKAERQVLADHAAIPLYFYVSKHLVSSRVSGWADNVLDIHYSRHLALADAT